MVVHEEVVQAPFFFLGRIRAFRGLVGGFGAFVVSPQTWK